MRPLRLDMAGFTVFREETTVELAGWKFSTRAPVARPPSTLTSTALVLVSTEPPSFSISSA